MIRSMTGYGRAEASAGPFRAVVEIRSVNHRYADVRIKLPGDLAGHEAALHRRLQGRIHRGKLDVVVTAQRGPDAPAPFEINRPIVEAYLKAAEQLRAEYRLAGEVGIDAILSLPEAIRPRQASEQLTRQEEAALTRAFDEALEAHDAMRREEGRMLAQDVARRVALIRKLRSRIEKKAPRIVPQYARRLRARLRELNGSAGAGVDRARVAQELALMAERSDITEELVRLAGYVEQLEGLLASSTESVGKKLDFIMQEMNREANTINSKAIDLAICQDALEVKAEVEKIREQVQNIE